MDYSLLQPLLKLSPKGTDSAYLNMARDTNEFLRRILGKCQDLYTEVLATFVKGKKTAWETWIYKKMTQGDI